LSTNFVVGHLQLSVGKLQLPVLLPPPIFVIHDATAQHGDVGILADYLPCISTTVVAQ